MQSNWVRREELPSNSFVNTSCKPGQSNSFMNTECKPGQSSLAFLHESCITDIFPLHTGDFQKSFLIKHTGIHCLLLHICTIPFLGHTLRRELRFLEKGFFLPSETESHIAQAGLEHTVRLGVDSLEPLILPYCITGLFAPPHLAYITIISDLPPPTSFSFLVF